MINQPTTQLLRAPSRLLAAAEAALIACRAPEKLPALAIRYVAALNRYHAARAYMRETELTGEHPTSAAVLDIAVEQMSTDELDTARELFAEQLDQHDFAALRAMLEQVRVRAADEMQTVDQLAANLAQQSDALRSPPTKASKRRKPTQRNKKH